MPLPEVEPPDVEPVVELLPCASECEVEPACPVLLPEPARPVARLERDVVPLLPAPVALVLAAFDVLPDMLPPRLDMPPVLLPVPPLAELLPMPALPLPPVPVALSVPVVAQDATPSARMIGAKSAFEGWSVMVFPLVGEVLVGECK